jgi:hypothetical protein
MHDGFQIVSHTEHSLVWVPPPTMIGRLPDGRHAWTEEVARVHAIHVEGEPFAFAWDHGLAVGFPKLRVRQLATWTDFNEIDQRLGLCPGSTIVEAYAIGWRGARKPRPIAVYPGGDLANYRELGWFDAHAGDQLTIATNLDDLNQDLVVVESLFDAAVAWGLPRAPDIPDIVMIGPDWVRRIGRRGMALIEQGDMTVSGVDGAAVLAGLVRTVGVERFAAATGRSPEQARELTRRHARAATLAATLGHRDLAQLARDIHAVAPRCRFEDCTATILPRCRYCPPHAVLVRRTKDRNRRRAERKAKKEKP